MPCVLAGRFYPKTSYVFQLKSQNLSIDCQILNHTHIPKTIKQGDWIALKLISQKNTIYQVTECQLLSPSSHFIQEQKFSYRNKGQLIQDWRRFLRAVKEFFYNEGLAYAETPTLVHCPGTEPYLQPFKTRLTTRHKSKAIHLATSPEMSLKKLLCQDWTDCFEIKKCYRNGELGPTHQAEFTMLEWYRAFYSLKDLIKETQKLLRFLKTKNFCKVPLPQSEVYTVQQLFKKHLNFSLTPETSKNDFLSLLKQYHLILSSKKSWEDLFFSVFLNCIEPKLPVHIPVFIKNYPPQLRGFAKLNKEGWSDRFELYWRGFEIANAFYEVTDSKEQLSLFKEHKKAGSSVPQDQELLSLMKEGMPPCSGIALGLDRLFLALYKKEDLKETRLFPL